METCLPTRRIAHNRRKPEGPTKFDLIVNLETANALGLTIPAALLGRPNEVIH